MLDGEAHEDKGDDTSCPPSHPRASIAIVVLGFGRIVVDVIRGAAEESIPHLLVSRRMVQ